MIDKQVPDLAAAIAGIGDGATIMCGGFGAAGSPDLLLDAIGATGVTGLVIIANNAGQGFSGLAGLIARRQVRKVICSFPRDPQPTAFDKVYQEGEVELELVPQGTLSERIRAGAAGIGAFYIRTSVGTELAAGKEVREIGGETHVLEFPIRADVALIRAHRADRWGNLVYRKAARNFNPVMASAAKLTVVQADEIVPLGFFDAENIHTPGVFVDRVLRMEDA